MEEELDVPMPLAPEAVPVPAFEASLANVDPSILDSVIEQVREFWDELKVRRQDHARLPKATALQKASSSYSRGLSLLIRAIGVA